MLHLLALFLTISNQLPWLSQVDSSEEKPGHSQGSNPFEEGYIWHYRDDGNRELETCEDVAHVTFCGVTSLTGLPALRSPSLDSLSTSSEYKWDDTTGRYRVCTKGCTLYGVRSSPANKLPNRWWNPRYRRLEEVTVPWDDLHLETPQNSSTPKFVC